MAKKKAPKRDGSILLTIFNPYGMANKGSLLEDRGNVQDREATLKHILKWLDYMGLTVSQLFAKRTELAIIIDVQATADANRVEEVIGMHHWNLFLDPCPPNWHKEVSYVFRCPSVCLEHLERTLGYEPINIDQLTYYKYGSPFASPSPPPTLPSENWPRAQGNLSIYLRPVALKKAPDTQVDAFLSSIDLPPPPSAIEGVSRAESMSSANDPSSDRKVTIKQESLPLLSIKPEPISPVLKPVRVKDEPKEVPLSLGELLGPPGLLGVDTSESPIAVKPEPQSPRLYAKPEPDLVERLGSPGLLDIDHVKARISEKKRNLHESDEECVTHATKKSKTF